MRYDKPVLLYGAGKEARSTREFLTEIAPETPVFVTTDSGDANIENTSFIAPDDLPDAIKSGQFGLIVKSPGVSLYKPVFDIARKAGIPVTSNLNLWAEHFRNDCTIIAITGTKGKSTTATLVHLMLSHSGIDASLAGNVGTALLDIRNKHKTIVLELSSYQTADMDFTADFVGLTNLYPEHVDWHGSLERYYADKLNLISRGGDFHIALSSQAQEMSKVRNAIQDRTRRIMVLDPLINDALVAAVAKSRLKGTHNLDNARLATRLAMAAGATLDGVLAGIAAFKPLPHRLEEHTIGKLTVVDDSISTTPEATKAALSAYYGHKIALIAGGHEREQDYTDLAQHLAAGNVQILVCLPITGTRLAAVAKTTAPKIKIIEVKNLEQGMQALANQQGTFDTIILSPGAPSYNQFKNFEERGNAFMTLAEKLFAN